MKKTLLSLAIASLAAGQSVCAAVEKVYNEPDSVYIFSYAHPEDEGRSGLKFAWSPDGDKWLSVSDGFAYLKCDFGRWGAEKRMIKPLLEKAEDGRWYCRWQLTPSGKVWGTSHSSDLLKWAPQQYVNAEKPAVPRLVTARQIVLDKDTLNGYMQKVPYADIEQLIRFAEHKKFRDIQNNERTEQDAVRFAGLKPVAATMPSPSVNISSVFSLRISIMEPMVDFMRSWFRTVILNILPKTVQEIRTGTARMRGVYRVLMRNCLSVRTVPSMLTMLTMQC